MISIFNKGCATPYAKESFKQNVMDYTIAIEKAIQKNERAFKFTSFSPQ